MNYPAFAASLLTFVAFLLLLLVSLSVPVAKTIYLLKLTSNISGSFDSSVTGSVNFGVWGYCVSAIEASISIFDDSTKAFCSDPKLGYTFDENLASALHVDDFTDLISHALSAALVLHPIACGLSFLTLLVSLFTLRRDSDNLKASRIPALVLLILGALTAALTTIVFIIDVAFVAKIRDKVSDETDDLLQANWGNAVWMVLGAAIALWLAMAPQFANACACGGRFRNRRNGGKY